MSSLAQQLQQPQGESSEEPPMMRRQHPMQGLTIETGPQKSDLESSSSVRSSLQSSDDDESSNDFQDYDIETTIGAWDQITELTHEITSSLMAKQASVLCQRFRRESTNLETGPPVKKRIVLTATSIPVLSNKVHTDPDLTVVTNDEDTSHVEIDEADAVKNNNQDGGLPKNLYEHVDRIGRMSRLVMEIEYCQKELRKEMFAMKEEDEKVDDA